MSTPHVSRIGLALLRGHCRLLWFLLGLVAVSLTGCNVAAPGRNVDGVRAYQSGQYQQAIQDFQQALAADPRNANAYYNLGATYHTLGKQQSDPQVLGQAEGLYHQCLDIEPNHVDCHRGLATLLVDTNRPDSAFTMMKRWAEQSQGLASPRIELARLYEEFGDRDSATRHLTDALYLEPKNSRAWAALGRLREEQGLTAQALSDYQQAYAINRFQPGLAERIASLQQGLSVGGGNNGYGGTQMVQVPGPATR